MTNRANEPVRTTRRGFLQQSGVITTGIAAGMLLTQTPRVHAAENNTIKMAVVGSGGRGRGAALQAMNTGPVKLWAVADVFEENARAMVDIANAEHPDRTDVGDRIFLGFDAYKKAIDSLDPGSVVLLTTPPVFRPAQLEYAVEKGMHVFMEKSFAVDTPGVKQLLAAGQKAKEKNLKIY